MLSRKCAVRLLDSFIKIYQTRQQYPLIISSSDGINTYKLPSLGYEVTDRHLPRGFVTSRKPNTTTLCDYLYCNYTNCSTNGTILACGHGYHNYCLQRCQFKCLICLEYLQNEIKNNINALITSLMKSSIENEPIDENIEDTGEDDLNDAEVTIDDLIMDNLLESAKKSFLEL